MGGYQSCPAAPPPAIYSLSTKKVEYALIPLLPHYFPDVEFPAFRALFRAREDVKTRYYYSRPEDDVCCSSGDHVSAEHLYEIFVTRQAEQIGKLPANVSCPIACAVGLVVTDAGCKYDAVFSGRRVRICGRVACRNAEAADTWSAGIYLSHHFPEGMFKYVAVAAASMFVCQTGDGGALEHFRGIQFTTLQQNLSMLRAIHTLRELVNRLPPAPGAAAIVAPITMSFLAQGNRYVMSVEALGAHSIAQRLAAIVQPRKDDLSTMTDAALRWCHFELGHRLPVDETVSRGDRGTSMDVSSRMAVSTVGRHDEKGSKEEGYGSSEEESRIFCVRSQVPLVASSLDEAVLQLSRIHKQCDEVLLGAEEASLEVVPDDVAFPYSMFLLRRTKQKHV
jgi:hypothetical protein